jgi:mannose/fructose/N-acetylgalactosamine-specific phosphotransferase system component IIB
MPIVLCRVDERLIHGQVVVGWGTNLHVRRIVVADDELADSAWEQELYRAGVPDEVRPSFSPWMPLATGSSIWRMAPSAPSSSCATWTR